MQRVCRAPLVACNLLNESIVHFVTFADMAVHCCVCSFGGMYVIGLAYRGTANNAAVQKLLHFAVADVSDDVRRAAVLCLGFVLMGVPEQCPRIVALLAESYNPHLRYGAPPPHTALSLCGAGMLEKCSSSGSAMPV